MEEVELKKKLLKLLEEDKEFRYAVSGLVGMKTVLDEIKGIMERLEVHDRKFEEILSRLEEHDRKFEEVMARLEEHDRKFEEILSRLEEHDRKFEEVMARLEEHDRKFEEILRRMEEMSARLEVTIGSMGRRWGHDLEKTVLNIFRETLEREGIKPGEVESFKFKDIDGSYTGRRGTVIQIDVLIRDSELYLMEVKSHAEIDHLERLADKVPIVEKILRRKASRVYLIAVNVDEEVLERARELGIRVIYGSIIPKPTP